MSREAEAKLIWENHCVSSQVSRRVVLYCKLFRFKKNGANNTEQGENSCCDLFLRKVCLMQLLRRDIGKCGKRTEQP